MDIVSIIIVAISIIFYIFEILPIPIIAMSSASLMVVFGVTTSSAVWASFASEPVLLVAGSSIVGSAIFFTGATKIITDNLLKLAKGKPNIAIYLMILIAGLLSSVMNNITSSIIFFPLIISIVAGEKNNQIYEQKYMQMLAITTSIGGMLTLVGSAVVMTASGLAVASGGSAFTFFQFTPIVIVLFITLMVYMFVFNDRYSKKVFSKKIGIHSDFVNTVMKDIDEESKKEYHSDNDIKNIRLTNFKDKGVRSLIIMLIMILGFITSDIHGISLGTIAIISGLMTVITKCFTIKQMTQKIDLNVILTIVGMTGTAVGFAESGGGARIAGIILNCFGANSSYTVIYVVLCLTAGMITQFMSNTGTIGIIIPIAVSLAIQLNVSTTTFVMGVTICSICSFLTPMANPVQAMVMNWGSYSFTDYIRYALPITLILLVISIVSVPLFYPF
ncbi:MAG: SLC13 family permease [Eubacteriales bacterium]